MARIRGNWSRIGSFFANVALQTCSYQHSLYYKKQTDRFKDVVID